MNIQRLSLISHIVCWLSLIAHFVYAWLGDVRTNLVEGYPVAVNLGSISLALGLASVFLTTHYLSAVGKATKSDFGYAAAAMMITSLLGIFYWVDAAWVVRALAFALIALALEFLRPNWIWELSQRLMKLGEKRV